MNLPPFHLAVPVHDLNAAEGFYGELLGCSRGRSANHWVDYDFYGHQLVCHVVPAARREPVEGANEVDGEQVPVPHFGVVLEMSDWHNLADKLQAANVAFVIEPTVRFAGLPGEQATMFLLDPSGNALEFKAFADPAKLFEC